MNFDKNFKFSFHEKLYETLNKDVTKKIDLILKRERLKKIIKD